VQAQPTPSPTASLDCIVGPWDEWGPCLAACGQGTHTRGRAIVQRAMNGGEPCPAREQYAPDLRRSRLGPFPLRPRSRLGPFPLRPVPA
jgi:hypothetical protein